MNLEYLKDMYQLTENEIEILSYLNQRHATLNEINIRTAAKESYTSPASIVRLAKKLNLSGYNELLYKIKESHLPSQNIPEVSFSEVEIAAFCSLMDQYESKLIIVLGNGFSSHVATYISEVLNFHYIPNISTAYTQLINKRHKSKHLFFFISHSGEDDSLKETVKLAKENGNHVISFLGSKFSSIATHSDLIFSTDSYSPFSTQLAQPQLFFGKTLVAFEVLICAYINHKKQAL